MSHPADLPLDTRFRLGAEISEEQRSFLNHHGFLHFEQVVAEAELEQMLAEVESLHSSWVQSRRSHINGIPVFFGRGPDGGPFIHRFAFTSLFCEAIRQLVQDERFEPIRQLIGADARVGEQEKDGVVFNRYINARGSLYKRLGWHTDGLRDIFYGRMPQQMLNVGLHFDHCTRADGGLRLIPGSHDQGFLAMCLAKPYFVWHRPDNQEICVETRPGDVTIHDGRLWHRVARSSKTGPGSLRRSMYVPYLTGPYEPKDEHSATPPYHRLGVALRALRGKIGQ